MPSRRTHPKTRNGCATCKKRRVKCDGTLPSCRNCLKYGSDCSFLDDWSAHHNGQLTTQSALTPPHFQQNNSNPASSIRSGPGTSSLGSSPERFLIDFGSPIAGQLTEAHVKSNDKELLDHYLTSTYVTISSKPVVQEVWGTAVPEEAVLYDYLMHGMLAFSAIHLMHIRRSDQELYEKKARFHQNMALTLSIPQLHDINQTNCHALFATSAILAIAAFALQSPLASISSSPLDDMADFFALLRGIKTVLRSAFDWIAQGKLNAMLGHDWHPPPIPLNDDTKAAVDRLTIINQTAIASPDYQEAYEGAIHQLMKAFISYSVVAQDRGLIFIWPVKVPSLYVALVKRKEPFALAVLAHYAVLLHSINGIWWSDGKGVQLVEAICKTLPADWQDAIQWPKDIVHGSQPLSLGG